MNIKNQMPPKASKPGLRMQELVAATKLPKSTILHYLSQGLLPEPTRTSPNMAYYDPQCIERINLIRQLQRRHRLSLSEIKRMFEAHEDSATLSLRLELNDLVFGPSHNDEHLNKEAFCKAIGLKSKQVRQLLNARLIMPLEENVFDQNDVSMGKIYAQALSWGIQVPDLEYYVHLGEKIVDAEMALRQKITGRLAYDEDAEVTFEMVKNARMSRAYIIDRLFQHRVAAMRDLKDEMEEQ